MKKGSNYKEAVCFIPHTYCLIRCHKTEARTVGSDRIRSPSELISRSVLSYDIMFSDCLLIKMRLDFSINVSVDICLKSGLFAYPLH